MDFSKLVKLDNDYESQKLKTMYIHADIFNRIMHEKQKPLFEPKTAIIKEIPRWISE